jgi:hypothetical protein
MHDEFETFYTVPADCRTTALTADICNTTTADHTIRLCFVPSGGTAIIDTAIFWDLVVEANSTATWTGPQTLKDVGSTIQGMTDVDHALTITISGVQKVTT